MKPRPGLSGNGLKWIAIFAMLIDHIGIVYMDTLPAPPWLAMRVVGRCAMPIMCFLLAQGFHYTRDRKKYALRLLAFALISQLPFNYFDSGNPFNLQMSIGYFNVLFTLLLGLCALWALKSKWKLPLRIAVAALCVFASILCNWPMFGVLFVLAFGLNFGLTPGPQVKKRQACWYSLAAAAFVGLEIAYIYIDGRPMTFFQFGVFLPLLLLAVYNGKKSGERAPAWTTNKWLFYVIYPLHLAVLGFLRFGI